MKRDKKGFTLVELLAVVIIIGIVLVIALQAYKTLQSNNIEDKFNKYLELVESATDLSIEGVKDDMDNKCRTVPYEKLKFQDLIKEDEISCKGNVYVRKVGIAIEYDLSQLTCEDKDGNTFDQKKYPNKYPSFGNDDYYKQCGGTGFTAYADVKNVKTNSLTAKGYCNYPGHTITGYKYILNAGNDVYESSITSATVYDFSNIKAGTDYTLTVECIADDDSVRAYKKVTTLDFSNNTPRVTIGASHDVNGWNTQATANIKFVNSDITDPKSYIYSDVAATSDKDLIPCTGDYDNGFTCTGNATKNIEAGKCYYSPKNDVTYTYNTAISQEGRTIVAVTCNGNCAGNNRSADSRKALPLIDTTAPTGYISVSNKYNNVTIDASNIVDNESQIKEYTYIVRKYNNVGTSSSNSSIIINETTTKETYEFTADYGTTYTVTVNAVNNAGLKTTNSFTKEINVNEPSSISLSSENRTTIDGNNGWAINSKVTAQVTSATSDINYYFRINGDNTNDMVAYISSSGISIYSCGTDASNYLNNCSGSASSTISPNVIYKMVISGRQNGVTYNPIFNIDKARNITLTLWAIGNNGKYSQTPVSRTITNVDNTSDTSISPINSSLSYTQGSVPSVSLESLFNKGYSGIAPTYFWCDYNGNTSITNVNEINVVGNNRVWCAYKSANGYSAANYVDIEIKINIPKIDPNDKVYVWQGENDVGYHSIYEAFNTTNTSTFKLSGCLSINDGKAYCGTEKEIMYMDFTTPVNTTYTQLNFHLSTGNGDKEEDAVYVENNANFVYQAGQSTFYIGCNGYQGWVCENSNLWFNTSNSHNYDKLKNDSNYRLSFKLKEDAEHFYLHDAELQYYGTGGKWVETSSWTESGSYKIVHSDGSIEYFRLGTEMISVFTYTGGIQQYTVQETGWHKLETWGAQGGGFTGGTGGYATGTYYLEAGTKLYIVVGGNGSYPYGGYNGGGNGTGDAGSGYQGAGGGGATHIATSTGILSSIDASYVLLVAGGGGGASEGGAEGGAAGFGENGSGLAGHGYQYGNPGQGGTQYSGGAGGADDHAGEAGSFGKGGNAAWSSGSGHDASLGAGGGGAGWYGGGAGGMEDCDEEDSYCNTGAGGGGSSHVSSIYSMKNGSYSNSNFSQYQWKGNGFAKITYLGN